MTDFFHCTDDIYIYILHWLELLLKIQSVLQILTVFALHMIFELMCFCFTCTYFAYQSFSQGFFQYVILLQLFFSITAFLDNDDLQIMFCKYIGYFLEFILHDLYYSF